MKHIYVFFVRSKIFFVFLFLLCHVVVQALPFKNSLKMLRSSTFRPRIAVTHLIAKARARNPHPIRMRTLSVPIDLKRAPVFPLEPMPHEIYRGLALDFQGKELRSILKEGMPVKTSHFPIWDDAKALFATRDPLLASTYAQMNRFREDDALFLPVVFHLKQGEENIAPNTKCTIKISHDIPPSWIYKVSVLLSVDGRLRWGELKLDGEEGFLFIPYPLPK